MRVNCLVFVVTTNGAVDGALFESHAGYDRFEALWDDFRQAFTKKFNTFPPARLQALQEDFRRLWGQAQKKKKVDNLPISLWTADPCKTEHADLIGTLRVTLKKAE